MGDRRSLREYLRKTEGRPLKPMKPMKPDQAIRKLPQPPKPGAAKPSLPKVSSTPKPAAVPLPKLQPIKMPDASTAALVTAVISLIARLDRLLETMERG